MHSLYHTLVMHWCATFLFKQRSCPFWKQKIQKDISSKIYVFNAIYLFNLIILNQRANCINTTLLYYPTAAYQIHKTIATYHLNGGTLSFLACSREDIVPAVFVINSNWQFPFSWNFHLGNLISLLVTWYTDSHADNLFKCSVRTVVI